MIKGPHTTNDPGSGDAVPDPAPKAAPVLLTKRTPVAPPDPKAPREKICAECGVHFKVEAGQKFYLCADCYRRSFSYKRKGGKEAARILTHITCAECGAQEYLPFIPDDPAKALCRACFAKQRPEPKPISRHPHR
jgi:CxxC-x17-CxxC domain-containing protein